MTANQNTWQAFLENQDYPLNPVNKDKIICELSNWGLVRVVGPDASTFLQGQISCDMAEVKGSDARLAACVNLKGRVIGNFIVCCLEADREYFLLCPPDSAELILKVLKKYSVFSKVELAIDTGEYALSLGVESGELAESGTFSIPHLEQDFMLLESEKMIELWNGYSKDDHRCHRLYSEKLFIQQGLVFINSRTSEIFTPQEINLDLVSGISFTKGCYTGQEVVARLHYRGQAKRRTFITELDSGASNINLPDLVGGQIRDNEKREQGHILSVTELNKGKYLALSSINLSLAEEALSKNAGLELLELEGFEGLKISSLSNPPYPLTAEQ